MRIRVFLLVLLSQSISYVNALDSTSEEQNKVTGSYLEQVNCWFDPPRDEPVTSCYLMHVPEDYADPSSRFVYFSVVQIQALDQSGQKAPVLHLGGGGPGNPIGFWPGGNVSWIWNLYQGMTVNNQRDLYIIDPRGVGESSPLLVCPEYVDMIETALTEKLSRERESKLAMDVYNGCRDRLRSENMDLSQYHSANVAKDMEQLRIALNLDRWNLYGVSYGTRYAQTLARDFPDSIESMVLDAATFPGINYTERSAQDYIRTLDRVLNYCESEVKCSSELGDVRDRFWSLVEQLEVNPTLFKVKHPYEPGKQTIMLTGTRFLNAYYNAIYDADYYADLPSIVKSLEKGKLGKFKSILYDWLAYILDRDYSDGAAITHYCYEEAPFVDFQVAVENIANVPEVIRETVVDGLEFAEIQCSQWNLDDPDPIEGQPISTDIPTLFLHGALDPVLPVEDLDTQLQYFSNSERVIFPKLSHGIVGFDSCGTRLARAFYDYHLDYRQHEPCLPQ